MRSSGSNFVSIMLMMVISPIYGLFLSIKHLSWPKKKWALIIFIVVFGSIILSPIGADIERYKANAYNYYSSLSFTHFSEGLWSILTFSKTQGVPDDLYIYILSYFTAGFLSAPGLLMVFAAFVYGYFYISSLREILIWDRRPKKSIIFIFLVLILIVYKGIDSMQTIRTWTGAWILFYGVLKYYQTNNYKYIILMLLAPLIHAAYLLMALPAYAVIFIKKLPPKFFVAIFALSFTISFDPSGIIQKISSTELGESKIRSYYREDARDYRDWSSIEKNWYVEHGKGKTFLWAGNALAITIILGGYYKKRMTRLETGLFSTGLFMASFANVASFIPEVYSRTMNNSGIYIVATAVLLLVRGELLRTGGVNLNLRKAMLMISIILFIPKIIYTIASMLYYTSVFMFIFPAVGWISEEMNASIRDILGLF